MGLQHAKPRSDADAAFILKTFHANTRSYGAPWIISTVPTSPNRKWGGFNSGADSGGQYVPDASLKGKLSALRKRAAGTEAVEADIEAAEDAEDPTAAMVALILAHEKPSEDPAAKLRAELEALKPSALRKRAKAAGASEDDIEDAGDAEEPKSAMIALILASAPEAAESER